MKLSGADVLEDIPACPEARGDDHALVQDVGVHPGRADQPALDGKEPRRFRGRIALLIPGFRPDDVRFPHPVLETLERHGRLDDAGDRLIVDFHLFGDSGADKNDERVGAVFPGQDPAVGDQGRYDGCQVGDEVRVVLFHEIHDDRAGGGDDGPAVD